MKSSAVQLEKLSFAFPNVIGPPIFDELSLGVPSGARVLLVGANGVGKSTLLRLIAGKHLVPAEALRVLGISPFHDLALAPKISWIGGELGINLDIQVHELLGLQGVKTRRERDLLALFEISPGWRMCHVSEGQRRRVQLLLGLRHAAELILLDEMTAHLDVTMRADFLAWLKRDCQERSATVIYATHIFDGLDRAHRGRWPSHLLWLGFRGKLRFAKLRELEAPLAQAGSLGALCEKWIRADSRQRPSRQRRQP